MKFSEFSMVFRGFGKAKEWVFNLIKVIFMRGRKEIMKTKGFLWRKRGENEGKFGRGGEEE